MNNLVEYIDSLKNNLLKKERIARNTGRTTNIIRQARKNGSTVVCAKQLIIEHITEHS